MPASTALLLLVIRAYDVAGVASGDLDTAHREATRILRRAGVNVEWNVCPRTPSPGGPACAEPLQPTEVILRLVRAPAGRARADRDRLGFAYVDTGAGHGVLATVYADRVATMAAELGLDAGTLLGRAIAHEIGHLLIGTNRHQPRGLMRAEWSAAAFERRFADDWQFSVDDVARLTERLVAHH